MKRKRVLIVDDEEDLTWSISKHLSKDKDKYELTAVNDAKTALEVLSQVPVDLVVSDIRMPEISGLDLLLEIRRKYPSTKVIIMTAYGSSEVQQEANERGCFKYLEKPFEIQELRQMILDGVEDKKGFEGRISDLQLSDLIQMNCLGRLTNALHVQKEYQKGVIYFEDGNIVHSSVNNTEGEDAFFEILSWEGGSFSVDKGVKPPKETIFKGWQSLLLEGLRRLDELRNPKAQEIALESQKSQNRLSFILSDFVNTKGVVLAAIFDVEGFSLASKITEKYKAKYKISAIYPVISKLQKQVDNVGIEISMNDTKEIIVEFEEGFLKLNRIPGKKEFFIVIADSSSNLGLLRMESKKYLKMLSEEL